MELHIKYMVSRRCTLFVKNALQELGIAYDSVQLGMVRTSDELTDKQLDLFRERLNSAGLDLLKDKKEILVERIKNLVIEMVHYSDEFPTTTDSQYLHEKLGYDYTYLSNTFSEINGMTIQHYIILNKIERAKELLLYDELTLTEIANKLHYSSVAHLSNQFKKITGLSPSGFKGQKFNELKNLEDL